VVVDRVGPMLDGVRTELTQAADEVSALLEGVAAWPAPAAPGTVDPSGGTGSVPGSPSSGATGGGSLPVPVPDPTAPTGGGTGGTGLGLDDLLPPLPTDDLTDPLVDDLLP
jgi:hypothetical protein